MATVPVPTRKARGDRRGAKADSRPAMEQTGFVEYVKNGGNARDWFALETAKRACGGGHTDEARKILSAFVRSVDQRTENTWQGPIHWAYARYIADAFQQILSSKGVDANSALGIKSKPGRKQKAGATHNSEGLAAAYNLLLLHGLTPKQAKFYLKEKTGVAVRTIEKANNKHGAYRLCSAAALHRTTKKKDREYATEIINFGANIKFDGKPYAAVVAEILAAIIEERRKSRVIIAA